MRRVLFAQYAVTGLQFSEYLQYAKSLSVGDEVVLAREPHNPHDSRAIRVDWAGRKLGYIPAAQNKVLARLLDEGVFFEAYVSAYDPRKGMGERVVVTLYFRLSAEGDVRATLPGTGGSWGIPSSTPDRSADEPSGKRVDSAGLVEVRNTLANWPVGEAVSFELKPREYLARPLKVVPLKAGEEAIVTFLLAPRVKPHTKRRKSAKAKAV